MSDSDWGALIPDPRYIASVRPRPRPNSGHRSPDIWDQLTPALGPNTTPDKPFLLFEQMSGQNIESVKVKSQMKQVTEWHM